LITGLEPAQAKADPPRTFAPEKNSIVPLEVTNPETFVPSWKPLNMFQTVRLVCLGW
jgi:hypothetical protein